jgi:hypothetical protein
MFSGAARTKRAPREFLIFDVGAQGTSKSSYFIAKSVGARLSNIANVTDMGPRIGAERLQTFLAYLNTMALRHAFQQLGHEMRLFLTENYPKELIHVNLYLH